MRGSKDWGYQSLLFGYGPLIPPHPLIWTIHFSGMKPTFSDLNPSSSGLYPFWDHLSGHEPIPLLFRNWEQTFCVWTLLFRSRPSYGSFPLYWI